MTTVDGKPYDLNRLSIHRDFYTIQDRIAAPARALYEQVEVEFIGEYSKSVMFLNRFPAEPIVTLEASGDVVVNPFLSTVTSLGITIETSAPFTGIVTYRAVYSPVYPVYVNNYPNNTNQRFLVSAAYMDVTSSDVAVEIRFNSLPSRPSSGYVTPYDVNASGDVDIIPDIRGTNADGILVDLSAPITNRLFCIAYQ